MADIILLPEFVELEKDVEKLLKDPFKSHMVK